MQLCARWRHPSLNRFTQSCAYSLCLWLMHALIASTASTDRDPICWAVLSILLQLATVTQEAKVDRLQLYDVKCRESFLLFPIPYFFDPCSNIHRDIFPSFDERMLQHSSWTWSFLRILDETMKFVIR